VTPSSPPAAAPPAHPVVRVQLRGKRIGTRVALWWHASGDVARFRVSVRSGRGAQRVLTAAASGRSAAYALGGGAYTFTVAALGANGGQLAVSAPWRVNLRQARR
jgi:hypothetical protein